MSYESPFLMSWETTCEQSAPVLSTEVGSGRGREEPSTRKGAALTPSALALPPTPCMGASAAYASTWTGGTVAQGTTAGQVLSSGADLDGDLDESAFVDESDFIDHRRGFRDGGRGCRSPPPPLPLPPHTPSSYDKGLIAWGATLW